MARTGCASATYGASPKRASTARWRASGRGGLTSAIRTTCAGLEVDERLADEWPTVKMMHGYFGTCVSGQKAFSFPHVQRARASVARRVSSACPAPPLRLPGYPSPMMSQFTSAARQRALLGRYAGIVVSSDHMRREYLAHGVQPDRTHDPVCSGRDCRVHVWRPDSM